MTDDEKKIIDEGGSDSDEEDEDVSQAGGNPSDTGSASDASTGTSGAGKKKKVRILSRVLADCCAFGFLDEHAFNMSKTTHVYAEKEEQEKEEVSF